MLVSHEYPRICILASIIISSSSFSSIATIQILFIDSRNIVH